MRAWERPWCGSLRGRDIGRSVELCGWVKRKRDMGGVVFVDLRDRSGFVQLVFEGDAAEAGRRLSHEDVLQARGVVRRRAEGQVREDLPTGEVEVKVEYLRVLSETETPPFVIEDEVAASEELRLRYRYLDLRRPEMMEKILLRHKVTLAVRNFFDSQGFVEVETPMLTRSTPEGARDFLVPSRMQKGRFYALPQSPQLFKQLLQVAGVGRYFQIARCFRDEDLRSDRQPEFTQVDVEASFVDEEDILDLMERMFEAVLPIAGIEVTRPFPRITFKDAMEKYGTDRPDIRFDMELVELGDLAKGCGFRILEKWSEEGRVKGIVLPDGASYTRKQLDSLVEIVRPFGAQGVLWFKRKPEGGIASPALKAIGRERAGKMLDEAGASAGDLLLVVAGPEDVVLPSLGALRLELARRHGLIPQHKHQLVWVTDFPLFEWSDEEERWVSVHHPFTSPKPEDLDLLETDPAAVRARAYDVVMDGVELGGGSVRIHDPELQRRVFQVLGLDREEAEDKFGFLLEAFRYGVPPHGGIALGLDRMVMLMAGAESIRDVIAFPKTTSGTCLMTGAPAAVSKAQLEELGLEGGESDAG